MQDRESEMFGLLEAWSQRFNIPIDTVRERMRDLPGAMITFAESKEPQKAYSESEVRHACADLLSQ
jgi:hypothetical protein